jgi:hypothetical protein
MKGGKNVVAINVFRLNVDCIGVCLKLVPGTRLCRVLTSSWRRADTSPVLGILPCIASVLGLLALRHPARYNRLLPGPLQFIPTSYLKLNNNS